MKRLFFICIAILFFIMPSHAQNIEFKYQGITYKTIDENTCYLSQVPKDTINIITIPSKVTYNDTNYTVVGIGCKPIEEDDFWIHIGPDFAFEDCTKVTGVNIPETVKYIGYNAFHNCIGIQHIEIPNNVTQIFGAFTGCTSLDNVVVPESITDMRACFAECTSLQSVKINAPVKSLAGVFYGCTSLKTVEIPETVEDLSGCFQYCGDIKVKIPESVTNMASTFYNSDVTSVIIPKNVTNIEKCYAKCRHITSANIPGSVKNAERAFENSSITEVYIEKGVEDVNTAFYYSDIKTITFPSTIKVLNLYQFRDCI